MTTTYDSLRAAIDRGERFRRKAVINANRLTDNSLDIDLGGCTTAHVKRGSDGIWRLTSTNTYGNYSGAVTGPHRDASGVRLNHPDILAAIDAAFATETGDPA